MSAQPITYGGGPSNQSIYDVATSPRHRPGTRAYLPDGRVFYYTENTSAAALSVGQLMVAPAIVANHQNLATASTSLVVGANVITDVTLGATAATVDQYADGYLAVTDGGGEGHIYQVKTHAAIGSAGTGDFTIYGKVAVASGASTTVSLFPNLYKSPTASATSQDEVLVGVPTVTLPIGSTTSQYGWLQTWGPCPVLCDESFASIGQAVTVGTGVAGAAEEDDTATTVSQEPIVGYNLSAFVDTEYQLVDLRIRP